MTAVYVDADACPVKDEAVRVAERHGVSVHLVCNGGLRPSLHPLVEVVIVPEGPDAADDWIAERAGPGDVCITGDIPLAARCLDAGAQALRHDGTPFTRDSIGQALAMRELMADLRSANPLGGEGGGRSFTRADRSRFLDALEGALRRSKQPR